MKKNLSMVIILVTTCLSGCTTGESYVKKDVNFSQYARIAIMPFELSPKGADVSAEQYFEQELLFKGYEIIERSQAESILKELLFQQTDLISKDNIAEMGRMLNVNALVIGNVQVNYSTDKHNEKYVRAIDISAKLVSVEDASILWSGSGTTDSGSLLGSVLKLGASLVGAEGGLKDVVKQMCEPIPAK